MYDVKCPYCDAEQEINHDDGYGYAEDGTYNQECGKCGKTFVYNTFISFDYEVRKADCMNGSNHDFKPSMTMPKCFTSMVCSMCDEQRQLTNEERIELSIPTYQEYLKEIELQNQI